MTPADSIDERASDAGGPRDRTATWYTAEVPPIVAGLEASGQVSPATAREAWRLIEAGAHDRALAVVLGEAA